jgi:hypothetical protein
MHERATKQFLISGHVDDGLRSLRLVLGTIGLKRASTPRRALLSLLFRRALLRLRGLHFKGRDSSAIDPQDLRRLEVLWSVAIGLSMVDNIQGARIHACNLLLALRVGEKSRVATALAAEGTHLAALGGSAKRRSAKLLGIADEVARGQNNPYAVGFVTLARAFSAYFEDRWSLSVELSKQADQVLRDHCIGVWWEHDTVQFTLVSALCHLGEIAELNRLTPPMISNAQQRGDWYALTTTLGTYIRPLLRLAEDQPNHAQRELTDLLEQWSQAGFHVQHAMGMYRQVEIQLYMGQTAAAHEYASRYWTAFAGSLLSRIQLMRIFIRHVCARAALAAASSGESKAHFRCAKRLARALERERTLRSRAFARLIQSGVAFAGNDMRVARQLLMEAAQDFDIIEMRLHAAATRRRLGQLIGGDDGRAMVVQADGWMTAQTIKNPVRMTAMLVPGFP